MTPTEVAELVEVVRACWPMWRSDNVSDDTLVRTWTALLGDIARDTAFAAVKRLAIEDPYVPGPGTIRRVALDLTGPGAPALDEAFAALTAAVGRYGYVDPTGALESLHPAVAAAVRGLGGWGEVCASTNPEALRAHFARVYDTAVTTVEREQDPMRASPGELAPKIAELAAQLTDKG